MYNIPFADETILLSFSKDNSITDFRIARKMTIIQMQAEQRFNDLHWTGYKLSDKPVLIFGFDNKPKYYEFIVYDAENKPSGTIITNARKTEHSLVKSTINQVRNYGLIGSKGSFDNTQIYSSDGLNFYTGNYTSNAAKPNTVFDFQANVEIQTPQEFSKSQLVTMLKSTNLMKYNDLLKMNDTCQNSDLKSAINIRLNYFNPTAYNEMIDKKFQEDSNAIYSFWQNIDKASDTLLNINDSAIYAQLGKGFWDWLGDVIGSVFVGPITRTQATKYEKFAGKLPDGSDFNTVVSNLLPGRNIWCGPSACNWIYYANTGLMNYNFFESGAGQDNFSYFKNLDGNTVANWFGNVFNPLVGKNIVDYFLSQILINSVVNGLTRVGVIPGKALTTNDMSATMDYITNGRVIINPFMSLGAGAVYQNCEQGRPSIMLVLSNEFIKGGPHWVNVYKAKRTVFTLFTNYEFTIFDNGYITNNNGSNTSWDFGWLGSSNPYNPTTKTWTPDVLFTLSTQITKDILSRDQINIGVSSSDAFPKLPKMLPIK